ncbi:hypothetical protein GGTG_02380 [Gaeumannomyces tritici R3-111a-1]|uniref:Uncharacterized protein n=1 Tax=Gaeumannomyces tritici (strain R3-111a-1) TaxID=644352 RepID=J3NM76_GAET3|nr:hypothetical protein GGTG_02380 [Gaeumannomyces tritici R3-111a-1]EJT82407.1 hypothetical protein GGTG_02380 [Gaeumannomyces tritici R3-111a-1]
MLVRTKGTLRLVQEITHLILIPCFSPHTRVNTMLLVMISTTLYVWCVCIFWDLGRKKKNKKGRKKSSLKTVKGTSQSKRRDRSCGLIAAADTCLDLLMYRKSSESSTLIGGAFSLLPIGQGDFA